MQELRVRRVWPIALGLAVVYFVTARLGLLLALPPDFKATAVWPPSGLSLAAVLLFGRRVWPGVWAGAFLANAWDALDPGRGPGGAQLLAAALIATGSAAQALVGRALVLRTIGPGHPLDRAADVFRFAAVAGAMCLVAASVGAAALVGLGLVPAAAAPAVWWTWWIGDAVGVLVVAPVLLSAAGQESLARPDVSVAERLPFMAALVAACGAVFGGWWGLLAPGTQAAYLLIPLLIWSAFRFGPLCSSAALLTVAGFAVAGTAAGGGPFGATDAPRGALLLSGFLATASVTVQVLRAAVRERARAEARFRQLAEAVPQLVWTARADGAWDYLSPQWVAYTGGRSAGHLGAGWSEAVHPDDRAGAAARWADAVARDVPFEAEERLRRADGVYRWFQTRAVPLRDEAGRTTAWCGTSTDIDDLKRTQADLARQRADLQLILDTVPALIFRKDVTHRLVRVNAAMARTLGRPRDELEGRTDSELGSPHEGEYRRAEREVMREGRTVRTREPLHTPAGTRWMDTTKLPYRDAGGRVVGVLGFAIDVTDQKAAEDEVRRLNGELERRVAERTAELRASEERYALVVRGSRDGIWDWNVRTGEVYFSARWKEQLGYAGDEVAPRVGEWERLLHPDDRPAALAALAAYFDRRADAFGLEVRMAHKDGGFRWMLTRGEAQWGADGRADRMAGSHTDVTERRQAEAALRESEGRFRGAFDHAPIGVALVAPGGRWLRVNRALCGLLGYTADELLATDFQTLTHPDDLGSDLELVGRVLGGELSDYQMEKRYFHKDGRVVQALLSVSLVRDDRGGPLYFISQIQDITARKAAEDRLRESEDRFRAFMDNAPMVAFLKDEAGRYVYLNRRFEEAHGVRLADWRGRNDFDVWPADLARQLRANDRAVLAADAPHEATEQVPVVGGEVRLWRAFKFPVRDAAGGRYVGGAAIDVTDERRAAAALRLSEERLAEAQRIARLGSWEWEPATGRVWWSDVMYELFGVDPARFEPTAEGFLALLHPDDRGRAVDRIAAVYAGADGFADDLRVVRPDGTVVWLNSRGRVTRGADGTPARVEGIDQEITDRKAAEGLVWESEERLRLAVDVAELGVLTVDYSAQSVEPSDRAAELFGFPPGAAVPREALYDRVHPGDRAELERRLAASHDPAGEGGFAMEFRLVRGDGRTAWVNARKRVFFEGGGRHRAVMVVADVTARRAAEEQVRASEERLRLALEAARLGTFDWDLGTDRIVWSGTHYALLGYDPGDRFEVRFHHFADRLHPGDRPRVEADIAAARESRRPYSNEFRVALPDGTVRWVLGSGEFRYGADGTPVRMLGTAVDVTARKRAEEDLQRANGVLGAVTQVQRESLITADPRDSFARVLALLLELTDSEYGFIGESLRAGDGSPYLKVHAFDDRGLAAADRAFFARNIPPGFEFRARGNLFGLVLTTAAPVLSNDPAADPRRAGTPPGHPPLTAFLGLPFFQGDELVGMVGLANRPGGYAGADADRLAPVLATCSGLVLAHRLRGERERAEERLRAAMAGSLYAIYFLTAERDPGGAVTDFVFADLNARGAELVGRPREQVLGQRLCELLPINRTGGFFDKYVNVLRTGEPLEEEVPIGRVDGITADWLRYMVVRAGDGVAITTQDITARKRAELALRDSEERFQAFMDNAPFAAWMVDEGTRGVYCSSGFERVTGLPPTALIGRTLDDLFPPAAAAQHRANNLAVLTSGRSLEAEEDFVRADGTAGVALVVKFPVREAGGRVLVGGMAVDITERKRSELALRASEARFRVLFEQSSDAHLIFTAEGGILDCNQAAVDMLRCADKGAVLARHPAELSPEFQPDGRRSLDKAADMDAAARRHGFHRFDWLHRRFDGAVFPCEVTLTPVDLEGRSALLVVWHDLTERKAAEDAVRASLREKEVMLKEIHHRVKNNLQIVCTLLDLQAAEVADPGALAAFRQTRGRVRSMALIHERLYRYENLARVEFRGYLENLADDLFRAYPADGAVRLAASVSVPPLPLDVAIPCGLLVNELMSNCLKYAFAGRPGGTIEVSLDRTPAGEYVLAVADDGVGLPPGFDPRRVTSFGLQLVATLADQLGGVLAAGGGPGARFTVRFPGRE